MQKVLYIFEYNRSDYEVESEWFVGDEDLSYSQSIKKAFEHLAKAFDEEVKDIKTYATIENIYIVDEKLISEVANSGKDKKYSLKKDHSSIKKQIKSWEKELDRLYKKLDVVFEESTLGDIKEDIQPSLEAMSHEMMAINM